MATKQEILEMSSKENLGQKEEKKPKMTEDGTMEEAVEWLVKLQDEEHIVPKEEKKPDVIGDKLIEETTERLMKLHYEFRLNSPEILERVERGKARARVSFSQKKLVFKFYFFFHTYKCAI